MSKQPDVAALQELLDKQQIGELQSLYMWAIDWREPDVFASVFTEDGTLEWPEGQAKGREAIRTSCVRIGQYYNKLATADAPKKPARLRHFVTNRVFDIKGDTARAWAYWFDINNDNQVRSAYVPGYGFYEDTLLRAPEGWRFTRRKVYNEVTDVSPLEFPVR